MSIFGSIMNKIFGHPSAQAQGAPVAATAAAASPAATGGTTPGASIAGTTAPAPMAPPPVLGGAPAGASPAAATAAAGAAPKPTVDVNAVLTQMASANGQSLNWKQSIVDLMKLLGLDSSVEARKELAQELHYSGDTNDSASMNIWLHKQVMTKLAENGGQVPPELRG